MKSLAYLDELLNGITMYRLLLYGLGAVAAVAILFGFTATIAYPGVDLVASLAILLTSCYVVNKLFAVLFDAATNTESSLITALILFFIMPPSLSVDGLSKLALAGFLAMASKYLLAWRRKHLFNPAAIAPVLMGLVGLGGASWWVGDKAMLPAVAVLGALIIRKIRKVQMAVAFGLVSVALITVIGTQNLLSVHDLWEFSKGALTSWPTVFLGTVMLTEPSTMPSRSLYQFIYAGIVAVLFSSEIKLGPFSPTPELALIIGNFFSYLVSPKFNLRLTFTKKRQLTSQIWEFVFVPDRAPHFAAGQYMEWTLPHHQTDGRGNRRTFTIASSPTEPEILLGIKAYEPSSSFKKALLSLQPGQNIAAGQINGDFTLPKDPRTKLLFVAGGIGVTPFRSMLKYIIDTNDARDVVLILTVSDQADLRYGADIFAAAERLGVLIVPLVNTTPTPDELLEQVPDITERRAFVSGPNAMVHAWQTLLHQSGVSYRHIKTDHFSGY